MNLKPKMQHFLMVMLCAWLGCVAAFAQATVSVKGTVYDETDEPIIGASVIVKGTQMGVNTDIDGNFAIPNVPKDAIIVFSYIGMVDQEIPATNAQALAKVVMKDNTAQLNEVVVVGYGVMKKKDLTGAVAQINPEKIADQNPNSVQDLLRGTPGLQIGYDGSAKGNGASITLRGKNALNTSATPLIVVDGMAFYGELSEINPDDIERIDVLKDASSAAIYGNKGAAGVIIITTKTGKEGKPVINVSANFGWSQKSAYHDFMDVDDYMTFREDWYKMQYTYGKGEDGLYGYYNVGGYPQGYFDNPSKMTEAQQQTWASQGALVLGDGESMMSLYARRLQYFNSPLVLNNLLEGKTVDWEKQVFRTGFNQDYNASISGATERVNYYFSVGYLNNEGPVQGNEYSAFRSNMKIRAKVTDWLEIGANVNFQNRTDGDQQVSLGGNYWDNNMYRNSPFAELKKEDGTYQQYPMTGNSTNGGYNYYFDRQYYDLDKGYTVLNSIFNVGINLPFNIKYQFNIAPRYQWFHDYYFMDSTLPNASASSRGANREERRWFDWNLNNTITWDYTFNEKHHVTLTAVQEAEEHKSWQTRVEARNITPSDVNGFHYIEGANKDQSWFGSYDNKYTAASYLGRAFYSYDNKYMITATFRRDGFSELGTNNPWSNFWSLGAAWNFSEEKWFDSCREWFNQGKLRVSYGTNGNRDFNTGSYPTLAHLNVGNKMVYPNYSGSGEQIFNSLTVGNLAAPNLTWEKTKAWNIGLDYAFLNYRISGSIDLYSKDTKDMIMWQRLPSFSGFSGVYTNLGEVTNKGIEISINTVNIDKPDFTWNTSFGFSYNKSEIKHLYYDYDPETGKELDDTTNGWFIGQPLGTIWTYEADGVYQNTPEDIAAAEAVGCVPGDIKVKNIYTDDDIINADGTRTPVYNDKDKTYQGTTTPPMYLNMRNDFTFFKNFTFSFSFYSYLGHKSTTGFWLNSCNGGSQVTNAFNTQERTYWTPESPTNEFARLEAKGPSNGVSGGVSKVYKRDFLRLDNISIGYILPQAWTRRFQVEKVRISASCNNVFTIGSWKWGDPETGGFATRKFNVGINVTI